MDKVVCPKCGEEYDNPSKWSREKCIIKAQSEKERIRFWIRYHPDMGEACRSVVENPPSLDKVWKEQFPTPKSYWETVLAYEAYRQGVVQEV